MTLTKLRAKTCLTPAEMAKLNSFKSVHSAPIQVEGLYALQLNGITSRWQLRNDCWYLISIH